MEPTRKEKQQTSTDLQISKLDRCARQESSSNTSELVLDLSRKNHVKHGTINTTNRYDSQNLAKQPDEQYQQASPSNTQEQCHPTRGTTMSPSSILHLPKTMYIRRQMTEDNSPMCNVPSAGVTLVTPLSLQPTDANISLTATAPTMTHIPYAETSLILPSTDKMTVPIPFSTKRPAQALETNRKIVRPFKVYPKNPPSLPMGPMLDYDSNERYEKFRLKMLESVKKVHESSNPKMRRIPKDHALPTSTSQVMDDKDTAYWERRKRNNAAAKRSRDARRAKEDELAIRVAFLEEENVQLKRILGKVHYQLTATGTVYDPNWFN